RVVSPMIAGPANFPVSQHEKAVRSEQKRLDELVSWSERAKEAIRRKLLDARSEEEVEAEKRQRLLNEVRLNIETIKRIDAGEYVGGRDLFKSSIEGFIRRAADRGDIKAARDRKSTRLNSSHVKISYAVFCLKKKINEYIQQS